MPKRALITPDEHDPPRRPKPPYVMRTGRTRRDTMEDMRSYRRRAGYMTVETRHVLTIVRLLGDVAKSTIVDILTNVYRVEQSRAYRGVQHAEAIGFICAVTIGRLGIQKAPGLQDLVMATLDWWYCWKGGSTELAPPPLHYGAAPAQVAEQLALSREVLRHVCEGWTVIRTAGAAVRALHSGWDRVPWTGGISSPEGSDGALRVALGAAPRDRPLGVLIPPSTGPDGVGGEVANGLDGAVRPPRPIVLIGGTWTPDNLSGPLGQALRGVTPFEVVCYRRSAAYVDRVRMVVRRPDEMGCDERTIVTVLPSAQNGEILEWARGWRAAKAALTGGDIDAVRVRVSRFLSSE